MPSTLSLIEYPRLTAEDEQSLAARRVAGDMAARDTLILANIPFALSQAAKFRGGRHARHLDDLRSIAISGLIRAVDRYRPGVVSRGRSVRFTTYAAYWIRWGLEVATVEDLSTIRLPRWTMDALNCERRGVMPAKFDTRECRDCLEHARRALGLEARGQITEDGTIDEPLMGMIPARDTADPARALTEGEPDPGLSRALARLAREHPMDHRIVSLVSPIDGSDAMSFTETGKVVRRGRDVVAAYYKRGLRILREYMREDDMDGVSEDGGAGEASGAGPVAAGWATGREAC